MVNQVQQDLPVQLAQPDHQDYRAFLALLAQWEQREALASQV